MKKILSFVLTSFGVFTIPNVSFGEDFLLTTDTSQCANGSHVVNAIPGGSSAENLQETEAEWASSGFNIGILTPNSDVFTCVLADDSGGDPEDPNDPINTQNTGVEDPEDEVLDQAASSAVVAINASIIQTNNIMTRLATLRAGRGFGFDYSNLKVKDNDRNNLSSSVKRYDYGGGASEDEEGGLLDDRLSGFINGNYTFGDYDQSNNSNGFDFDSGGVTLGVDYRLFGGLFVGTSFGYTANDTHMNQNRGGVEGNAYSLSFYTTYSSADHNFYIDALTRVGWNDYSGNRNFTASLDGSSQQAGSSYKGNDYSFSLGTGYNWNIQGFNIDPYARLDYIHNIITGYSETGNPRYATDYLSVETQKIDSMRTALGFELNYIFNTSFAVLSPLFRAEWQHEFMNDNRLLTSYFTLDPSALNHLESGSPDRDFANLSFGLTAAFPYGVSGFFIYETMLANHLTTSHSFNAGVRVTF